MSMYILCSKDMADESASSKVGFVSQFPEDYLHMVCLGLDEHMLHMRLRGALNISNCKHSRTAKLFNKCIPIFPRKPQLPKE